MARRDFEYSNKFGGALALVGVAVAGVGLLRPWVTASSPELSVAGKVIGAKLAFRHSVGGAADGGGYLEPVLALAAVCAVVMLWRTGGGAILARLALALVATALIAGAVYVIVAPKDFYIDVISNSPSGITGEVSGITAALGSYIPGGAIKVAFGTYLVLGGGIAMLLGAFFPYSKKPRSAPAPMTNVSDSYSDGYRAGFEAGLRQADSGTAPGYSHGSY